MDGISHCIKQTGVSRYSVKGAYRAASVRHATFAGSSIKQMEIICNHQWELTGGSWDGEEGSAWEYCTICNLLKVNA